MLGHIKRRSNLPVGYFLRFVVIVVNDTFYLLIDFHCFPYRSHLMSSCRFKMKVSLNSKDYTWYRDSAGRREFMGNKGTKFIHAD